MDIDAELKQIESRIGVLIEQQFESPACKNLRSACKDTMQTVIDQAFTSSEGGKRLRALLALCSYDAVLATKSNTQDLNFEPSLDDPKRMSMIDMACAIEVFQTAALIHDDIIDESSLRRGKPSAYYALTNVYDSQQIGTGLGLMLGDLLASESFDIARNSANNLSNTQELLATFADTQRNVCLGQVLDLSIEMMDLSDPKTLADSSVNVFRWKTASYTTVAPMHLGLLAAGFTVEQAHDFAYSVGEPLGIAFQLADDLLDVVSDPKHTGKPVGGDIREGKRATLLADALQTSNESDRKYLQEAYTKKTRDDEDVKKVISILHTSGAIDKSKERIKDLWNKSQEALDNSDLNECGKDIMRQIMNRFIPEQWRK